MAARALAFVASEAEDARAALTALERRYGHVAQERAEVVVALGGDGFMLETLHRFMDQGVPIYGMNRGTVGFLMNAYSEDRLPERVAAAKLSELYPLRMTAFCADGSAVDGLGINEVALLRQTRHAAKIRVTIDGRVRLPELFCDGVMVATPAGSTAYNSSAHGPILPLGSKLLALTPICPFRPRRWRGALLAENSQVRFDMLEADRRPVSATADYTEARFVHAVDIGQDRSRVVRLMFDPDHLLEERIVLEQFIP